MRSFFYALVVLALSTSFSYASEAQIKSEYMRQCPSVFGSMSSLCGCSYDKYSEKFFNERAQKEQGKRAKFAQEIEKIENIFRADRGLTPARVDGICDRHDALASYTSKLPTKKQGQTETLDLDKDQMRQLMDYKNKTTNEVNALLHQYAVTTPSYQALQGNWGYCSVKREWRELDKAENNNATEIARDMLQYTVIYKRKLSTRLCQ